MRTWKSYEEVATYLLNHFAKEFGFSRVESKQKIHGFRSGTDWEIDAKGIREGAKEGFIIIECRRYVKAKQNQEKLGSLAYRILDTGVSGGITVSPLGIQEGAAKIAAKEKVLNVQLNADCTPEEFCIKFLNKLTIGITETVTLGDTAIIVVYRNCRRCRQLFQVKANETVCPYCLNKDLTEA
jgi:hypothetical protein